MDENSISRFPVITILVNYHYKMGSTRKNSKQVFMKTNETHGWLPDGWFMESKIRKSGARVGTEYKCYVDPSSRSKFYSKPEVLRYLKTRKQNADSSDQQNEGAAMESTNKSDKRPLLVSEPVPHHSNSAEESDQEYRQRRSGSTSTSDKTVVVEREKIEDLPDGWIKETRTRETTHGIRKDPYYKDPVSGRVFRSKKEVFRFLGDKFELSSAAKSQELKYSSTRRELSEVGKEESDLADVDVSVANMQKEGQDNCLTQTEAAFRMQLPKSATAEPFGTEENFDRSTSALLKDEDFAEELDINVSAEAGEVTPGADELANTDIVIGKVQGTSKKSRSKAGASNEKNVGRRSRYSRRLSGVEPELGTKTMANEQDLLVLNGKPSQNRTILSNNLASEESQKLVSAQGIQHSSDAPVSVSAGLDGGTTTGRPNDRLVVEVKMQKLETGRINDKKLEAKHCVPPGLDFTTKQASSELPVEDSPHTGSALAFKEDLEQEDKLLYRRTQKVDNANSRINTPKNKKENSLTRRSSKRLAGVEPELIGNSISREKALEYTSKRSKKEVTVVSSETMVSQQLEDPEAENLEDEKGDSNLSFSFHYSWSDPCLEFAIKTLTGALPDEDTVDVNPILNMGKKNLPQGMNESGIKSYQVKTKKSKELNLPSRSSKRLAGQRPELVAKPSSERALEYTPGKSYKESRKKLNQQIEAGSKIDLTRVSDCVENTSGIQLSNPSDMSCKGQATCEERQKNMEVEEIEGEKSDPQTSFPFCESWSDPCIDFAIKTLTGALSEEDTPHVLRISNPESNTVPYRENSQNMGERSIANQVCQPANLPATEPEWMVCSTSSNSNKKQATEQSFGEEAKVEGGAINGAFQHLETRGETELGKFDSAAATTSMHEASSEKIRNDFACQNVPEVPNSGSFLESWSDPCLDFAIKTLTGGEEENSEIPGYLQEVHTSATQSHASSVLPDLGLPAFFQNDIASHFDVPEKSGGVQQLFNMPVVAPGDASLANCAGTDSSRRYLQSSKNMHEGKLLP